MVTLGLLRQRLDELVQGCPQLIDRHVRCLDQLQNRVYCDRGRFLTLRLCWNGLLSGHAKKLGITHEDLIQVCSCRLLC